MHNYMPLPPTLKRLLTGSMDRRMDGRINSWKAEWMDRALDGWAHEWMDGWRFGAAVPGRHLEGTPQLPCANLRWFTTLSQCTVTLRPHGEGI